MADASQLHSGSGGVAAIRASVLLPLVRIIDERSGKTDIFLAGYGILRDQLADPYALIPMTRYVAIFEEAAALLRDPILGARLGAGSGPGDIGPIGMLFSLSATMRDAFSRLSRYVRAVQGATACGLIEASGRVVWSYGLTDAHLWPRRQDSEFTLAVSCRQVRLAFGARWRPAEIHFEHGPPHDPEPLRRIFGCPILFGQSGNRIVMDDVEVDRPYRAEDPALIATLERHIADLLGETAGDDSILSRVRSLIGIYLGHKPITIRAFAADLGISPRTLQRRLSDEGTSLRALVRAYREEAAGHLLDGVNLGHSRIAHALGYADSTVFGRAYKTWTGSSPRRSRGSMSSAGDEKFDGNEGRASESGCVCDPPQND